MCVTFWPKVLLFYFDFLGSAELGKMKWFFAIGLFLLSICEWYLSNQYLKCPVNATKEVFIGFCRTLLWDNRLEASVTLSSRSRPINYGIYRPFFSNFYSLFSSNTGFRKRFNYLYVKNLIWINSCGKLGH